MERMHFHQHKFVLTLTTILVAIIAVVLGVQLNAVRPYGEALGVLSFSFLLILMVISFISISITLRTREELHTLHGELHAKLSMLTIEKSRKKK